MSTADNNDKILTVNFLSESNILWKLISSPKRLLGHFNEKLLNRQKQLGLTGFLIFYKAIFLIPVFFPEKVPTFHGKCTLTRLRNHLLSKDVCNIHFEYTCTHQKHYSQSVNGHNLDTWYKIHISHISENLSLMGHCQIYCVFPYFWYFSKFSLTEHLFKVSLISRVAGILQYY